MIYDELRHLADSWGLVAMTVMFIIFVGWTFLPGQKSRMDEAATMIFKDSDDEKAD